MMQPGMNTGETRPFQAAAGLLAPAQCLQIALCRMMLRSYVKGSLKSWQAAETATYCRWRRSLQMAFPFGSPQLFWSAPL